jgi:hypothetical protein
MSDQIPPTEQAVVAAIGASQCYWCLVVALVVEELINGFQDPTNPDAWLKLFEPRVPGFLQWFIDLFGGRPKLGPDSATDNAALSFLRAQNPVLRMYGAGLRLLEGDGVAISESGGAGRDALNALTARLSADLQSQFGDQWRPYFDWAISTGFSHDCTDTPCGTFSNDTVYTDWVRAGWLDENSGMNLTDLQNQLATCNNTLNQYADDIHALQQGLDTYQTAYNQSQAALVNCQNIYNEAQQSLATCRVDRDHWQALNTESQQALDTCRVDRDTWQQANTQSQQALTQCEQGLGGESTQINQLSAELAAAQAALARRPTVPDACCDAMNRCRDAVGTCS